jgi:hypothetical protein
MSIWMRPTVVHEHVAIYLHVYEQMLRERNEEDEEIIEAHIKGLETDLVHGRITISTLHLATCIRLGIRPANAEGINLFLRTASDKDA